MRNPADIPRLERVQIAAKVECDPRTVDAVLFGKPSKSPALRRLILAECRRRDIGPIPDPPGTPGTSNGEGEAARTGEG